MRREKYIRIFPFSSAFSVRSRENTAAGLARLRHPYILRVYRLSDVAVQQLKTPIPPRLLFPVINASPVVRIRAVSQSGNGCNYNVLMHLPIKPLVIPITRDHTFRC